MTYFQLDSLLTCNLHKGMQYELYGNIMASMIMNELIKSKKIVSLILSWYIAFILL